MWACHDVGHDGQCPGAARARCRAASSTASARRCFEQARFTRDGQLLTATLNEYPLPRATQVPNFELVHTETPTQHTELGAKGAGELGTVGAAAAVANAVCDALSDLGVTHIEMPITPEKVWRAIA